MAETVRYLPSVVRDVVPFAPPIRVAQLYSRRQREGLMTAIRRAGPVRHILGRHTTDAYGHAQLDPIFRGDLALESICLDPAAEVAFFSSKLMKLARSYRRAAFCLPRQLAFNITVPCHNDGRPHTDVPAFRGLWHLDAPPWLLWVMGYSGLFDEFAVKMVQITTWFWRGSTGGFTCWPNGTAGAPLHVAAPVWNGAVVAENQKMFHRPEPILTAAEDDSRPEIDTGSCISVADDDGDLWLVRTGGKVVARYSTNDLRFMVHWGCVVFDTLAEVERHLAGTDSLTLDIVFDRLTADLRRSGSAVSVPPNPLDDRDFRDLLVKHYGIDPPTVLSVGCQLVST